MTGSDVLRVPADLAAAKVVLDLAHEVVDKGIRALAEAGSIDDQQVLAYDLAHAAAAVGTGRAMLSYGEHGPVEAAMTCAFVADAVADLAAKLYGREDDWGVAAGRARRGPPLRGHLSRPRLPGRAGRPRGSAPPRRRLRAGAGHLPSLRRGQDPAHRRARPPPQRRHPRRHHRRAWPRWAGSACRSRPSTAATARAARASTWAWWWPPRSCRVARWGWAARSSPGPRS